MTDRRFAKRKPVVRVQALQERAAAYGYELTVRREGPQDWVYELRALWGQDMRLSMGGGASLGVTLFAAEMAVVEVTTPRR